MPIPVAVTPLEDMKLNVKYSNGIEGVINLGHLREREEYSKLLSEKYFRQVDIHPENKDIFWEEGISICKDAVYKQLELKTLMKKLHIDLDKCE